VEDLRVEGKILVTTMTMTTMMVTETMKEISAPALTKNPVQKTAKKEKEAATAKNREEAVHLPEIPVKQTVVNVKLKTTPLNLLHRVSLLPASRHHRMNPLRLPLTGAIRNAKTMTTV
jgi:hypothetical protein